MNVKHRNRILVALTIFVITALMYFIPQVSIPHKICLPLLCLGLFSIGIAPWQITVALLFSALGDLSGSFKYGADASTDFIAFVGQMLFFALAHVFYVTFFLSQALKNKKKAQKSDGIYLGVVLVVCVALIYIVMDKVVPCVESPVLSICVTCYACIITVMLFTALMQKDLIFGIGAALFVASDFTLAWNMFVSPIPGETYLIMVPYYLAQLLIAGRSVEKVLQARA